MKMDKKDVHIAQFLLKLKIRDVLAAILFLEQNQENLKIINTE